MEKTPLIIGFEGTTLSSELKNHLLEINPAGVILFRRNIHSIPQVRELIADIKNLLGDIIVSVDHEGGIVSRFPPDCPVPPSPLALGKTRDRQLTREACRGQAELAAHLGFNLNMVPVLDLWVNPDNTVIGTRSYSGVPREVAEYSEICMEEHERLGVACCGKHFPGHGRTISDSHFETGVVNYDSDADKRDDLLPFRHAVKKGVPCMMTAHLTYPQIDPDYPASLSKKILGEELRTRLAFNGLIISDCIEMAGLGRQSDTVSLVGTGLQAGVDLFISSFSLKRSYTYQKELKSAILKAGSKERTVRKNLEEVDRRLKTFLERYSTPENKRIDLPEMKKTLDLHERTLKRAKRGKLPEKQSSFFLVEFSNRDFRGINADDEWLSVSKEILARCPAVKESRIIYSYDVNRLLPIIEECNRKQLTCLVLTANGFRDGAYSEIPRALSQAESSMQIALLDERDLTGNCDIEWATWGFNHCTGRMLSHELLRLV